MVRTKKYIALILLLVISVVLIPKELIHSLTDHADTEDGRCVPNAPISFEKQHQHCEFLKLNVPHYFFEHKFFLFALSSIYYHFSEQIAEKPFLISLNQSCLRGPPTLFS